MIIDFNTYALKSALCIPINPLRTRKDPFLKRILIVDDDPDITLAFKVGLEEYYYCHDDKRRFEVYAYNIPVLALSEFKPHFYDLFLTIYQHARDEWI
jgi:hypothetical protein